jgi:hypothetical protein
MPRLNGKYVTLDLQCAMESAEARSHVFDLSRLSCHHLSVLECHASPLLHPPRRESEVVMHT